MATRHKRTHYYTLHGNPVEIGGNRNSETGTGAISFRIDTPRAPERSHYVTLGPEEARHLAERLNYYANWVETGETATR